jgi:hypothetical protein
MGSNTGRADERPQHTVYLDAFELDRYEVTNAQYRRFLQVSGRRPPPYWAGDTPGGQADYPVVGGVGMTPTPTARGPASACPPRPNGKRRVEAQTGAPTHGATCGSRAGPTLNFLTEPAPGL